MKGKLIVIEGVDGSGKSTQVKLLEADQKLAFPRYDKFIGRIIKYLLHWKYGQKISPYLLAFLFAIDRLSAKSLINNWLREGKTVLLDRYTGSSQAHQGAKLAGRQRQQLVNWIEWLEQRLFKLPRPDKVIFLSVPPPVAFRLIQKRGRADEAEKNLKYQQQSLIIYNYLASINQWQTVNCLDRRGRLLPVEKIHVKITACL